MKRSRLRLQLVGWALVIGLHFAMDRVSARPLEIASEGADPAAGSGIGVVPQDPWDDLARHVWVGVAGCAASFALWAGYRRLPLPRSAIALAAGATAGSMVGAALWHAIAELPGRVIAGEGSAAGIAVGFDQGGVLLKLFVMGSWHGVAHALAQAERAGEAERLAQAARLEALRYQLNPHFLFNALNSAVAMIDEAPARAQLMLTQLSGLLRRTLREAAITTVAEELELVTAYLAIERLRYEENLQVELDCQDEARACRLPPLTVHGLVENAVKHGMRSSALPLAVRVSCKYDGRSLRIEVRNGGRLDREDAGAGVGLRNLTERLEALYPGGHDFTLEEQGGEVCARVVIRQPEETA